MTCIVGMRRNSKVWLGGDSAGVDGGYNLSIMAQPKVFRIGEVLIGYTSSFRMGQVLQHSLTLQDQPQGEADVSAYMVKVFVESVRTALQEAGYSTINNNVHTGGIFLVGLRGRLFRIEQDYSVIEDSRGIAACGCGAPYALGAMSGITKNASVFATLRAGLKAASEFSAGVIEPFHIVGPV